MQPLELSHLLATVKCYEKHPCSHFLGPSVIVTSTTFPPCLYQELVHVVFMYKLPLTLVWGMIFIVGVPLHSKS